MSIKKSVKPVTAQSTLFKNTLRALDIDEESDISEQHERIRRVIYDIDYYVMEKARLELRLERAYKFIAESVIKGGSDVEPS